MAISLVLWGTRSLIPVQLYFSHIVGLGVPHGATAGRPIHRLKFQLHTPTMVLVTLPVSAPDQGSAPHLLRSLQLHRWLAACLLSPGRANRARRFVMGGHPPNQPRV